MALIDIDLPESLTPYEKYRSIVRDIAYTIAHSSKIPDEEKSPLIKAVESYYYDDESLTTRQRQLLYKIREE